MQKRFLRLERLIWLSQERILVRMLLVRRVACYLTPVKGRGRRCGAWCQGRPWYMA